ncbi:MAG: amino acid-binding protein [Clostridia bacterium]|nr:amino acid-binding protein [Clostridia bacterium]
MFIKQLSIFVENKHGRIENIISSFADNDINIRALSIADTTDFGVLRVIVDDVDKAKSVLREIGIISKTTDVLAIYIDDKTGGLAEVLKDVSAAGVSVEYMYAFLSKTQGKALMVLKADDEEGAEIVLRQHGIAIAEPDDIK